MANPQQQARDNMRRARPQGVPPNELRPLNLYYDHGSAKQTFHPLTGCHVHRWCHKAALR
jgi:hypothetical protein